MRGVVTIHQPNYLPWAGLFSKISQADYYVAADTFQFEPIVKRNRIRTEAGSKYLTIPIGAHYTRARIVDIPLPEDRKWQKTHWRTITLNYSKAPYFKEHAEFFDGLYRRQFQYLWELNLEIINYLLRCFEIEVEIVRTSELELDPEIKHTDGLIEILKRVGAKTYLSGPSGKDYLEYDKFPQNGLELKFFSFQHPVYEQRYAGFEPNLSAIDILFNLGPQAAQLVKDAGKVMGIDQLTG